jgi:hypothetical protein
VQGLGPVHVVRVQVRVEGPDDGPERVADPVARARLPPVVNLCVNLMQFSSGANFANLSKLGANKKVQKFTLSKLFSKCKLQPNMVQTAKPSYINGVARCTP